MSRIHSRNTRVETSSDDDRPAAGAAAALRSIKRKHINSRSVSPTPTQQNPLPGLAHTSWLASSDDPPSPEAARRRQSRQPMDDANPEDVVGGKPPKSTRQKLRRKGASASAPGETKRAARNPELLAPLGHPSIASAAKPPELQTERASHDGQRAQSEQLDSPQSPEHWTQSEGDPGDGERSVSSTKRRPMSAHADIHSPLSPEQRPPKSPPVEPEGPTPPVDPRKMLLLMRKTAGHMQGQLRHREKGSHTWIRSHCHVDAEEGSLISEDEILGQSMCLFRDLRQSKVRAHLHTESNSFILQLTSRDKTQSLQLSPPDHLLFNAWFAALLCWRPIQQGQRLLDKGKQHRPILIRQPSDYLPKVDPGLLANPVRKAGNAVLVEPDHTRAGQQGTGRFGVKTRWRTVSCTLNARGELRVHCKTLGVLVTVLLAELPRSSIQRLSATVLGADCVVAIYPQYGQNANACSRIRPIYLSFESRELFEVWYVLLRAHAIPELFGASRIRAASETQASSEFLPGIKQDTSPPLFRMASVLQVSLREARLWLPAPKVTTPEIGEDSPRTGRHRPPPASYFAEILIDGHVKARSTFRFEAREPVWYESFDFSDLPNMSSTVSVRLKKQNTSSGAAKDDSPGSTYAFNDGHSEDAVTDRLDVVCGEAIIERATLEEKKELQDWFELENEDGNVAGEVALRMSLTQQVVLMDQEYDPISGLLHNFTNCLTLQISERIPDKLHQLSEVLLNIFQVSNQAGEWLMFLAEDEIDGVREIGPGKSRFIRRLESTESRESLKPAEREDMVRDMGRSAAAEANLLFRGNTLLSKALDAHMRRLGRDYLELTLGSQLRVIAVQDWDCEVDPTKISNPHHMQKHWQRLLGLTEQTWKLIANSAEHCPVELRIIFRHIRACADDRYGDYLRSVPYSAVSGFLFLRFFCAAVLNPQLFLLVDSTPRLKAQRTYVLLAKSLQGLANMSTFGQKEPWMSPMNAFLNSHRQEFKTFIEDICNVPSDEQPIMPASYHTPYFIFQKSPLASREGFPSLPYLIDRAHNLATLVELWLEGVSTAANGGTAPPGASNQLTGDLARFHDFCLGLHQRTRVAYRSADRAAGATTWPYGHGWSAIAQQMEIAPEDFWVKQRGERWHKEGQRGQGSSPLGGRPSGVKIFSPQSRSGSRGGREETWKPLTIRRRAGSQPVASASRLRGEGTGRDEASETEGEGEEGAEAGFRSSDRPMTPQAEERENHWRHFWRKRGRTPDKRDSTM